MKIGTFTEACHTLTGRYCKIFRERSTMIALWFQLALIIGMFSLYLLIQITARVESHASSATLIQWGSSFSAVLVIGAGLFVFGLPALALVLGICGILPGTRRKQRGS